MKSIYEIIFRAAAGLFAAALLLTGCATFTGDIETTLGIPDIVYISPENQDGIQDSIEVSVDIPGYKNLAIHAYSFTVKDENGVAVYSASGQTVKKRPQSGLNLPSYFGWDGRNSDGEFVPEGEYSYSLKVEYGKDNVYRSKVKYAVVDNTPPRLELSSPFPLFSPNGDGRSDSVRILQRNSSVEQEWIGSIKDTGMKNIRDFSWKRRAMDFNWDGRDEEGETVPDGVYSYMVGSTDLAGNSAEFTLANIRVDTSIADVTLDVSDTYISPDGNGVKDTLQFLPVVSDMDTVTQWMLNIYNAAGETVRTYGGERAVPEALLFDGRDAQGGRLGEGVYKASIIVNYMNGNRVEQVSPLFYLDLTPPFARITLDYALFSPNGDGRKDELIINQSTSPEKSWRGEVLNSAGMAVRVYEWEERAVQLKWDGRDDSGTIVPDGFYSYALSSTDEAGNSSRQETRNIRLMSARPAVSVTLPRNGASPNGDGIADTISFNCKSSTPNDIESWEIVVFDEEGNDVRRFSSKPSPVEALPAVVTWDGRQENGLVSEGEYFARLSVLYDKGDLVTARTPGSFQIDISGPMLNINAVPRPFSPDSDGVDDTVMLNLSARDVSGVAAWNVIIYDPADHQFIEYSGRDQPKSSINWDGRSTGGTLVESASDYRAVFSAEDYLGNTAAAETIVPVDILVLRDGENLKIIISSIYFVPYTADYFSEALDKEKVERNLETLDRLAAVLKKYGQYRIRLEGHAVREYWDNPVRVIREENEELLPLSIQRAEAIRDALEKRGIAASRMITRGFGGTRPIVPHSDLDNRWKNRRVEFILIKK